MGTRKEILEVYQNWQFAWGTPQSYLVGVDSKKLEVAFFFALLLHIAPFGFLWHKHMNQHLPENVLLQNVDLMEPEPEFPPAPPLVEVQKPKSALDFLKMALPIFKRAEAPREIITPKIQEAKLAEPDKLLMEKKMAAPLAPEIKFDAKLSAPKIADLSKIPQQRPQEKLAQAPALNLEEVGRKAVALPQTPAIALDTSKRMDRMADVSSLSKQKLIAQAPQSGERLVDRSAPSGYKQPSALPLGYQRRDSGSVSLDAPREVVRKPVATPIIEASAPRAKDDTADIKISRDRVKITGPLSGRRRLQSPVPEYPAWARSRNIEAEVAIRFTVSPSGDVLPDAVVERTSGYIELDKLALEHLRQWKFSPLPGGGQDQWGVITFRYLLD